MEEKEIIEADISMFAKYNRYLSSLPLEAILIQHFKMSFQTGDNSVKLDEAITRMLLKKNTATKAEIFNVVNKDRYYKCIYAVNNIVE
jgi:IS5 family transposase